MGRLTTKKTVTLQDYELFLENPYDESFSIDQLNEVILMHGFNKVHKRPKRDMYDALSTIDMMKPQRSTLKDKLSLYDSSLSLDQVKQDLEALNWQECPVQSIETIGHSELNGSDDIISNDLPVVSSFKISRKRRRSKRSKRMMSSIADDGGATLSNIAVVADVDCVGCNDVGAGAGAAQYDSSLFVDTYSWEF